MKKIKSFDIFLNESENIKNIPTDPKLISAEAEKTIKTIEGICKGILEAKDMQEDIKAMQNDNADLSKSFMKYFKMAEDASKLIGSVRKIGISKETKRAAEQLRALTGLEENLREAFDNMKVLKERTREAFKSNEGIGSIIGNVLRNLLTGQFFVNLLKNTKQNLKDSYTDMYKVQDVFDIKE